MIYKALHIKLNIEQDEPNKHRGWTQVLRKGKQFLFHSNEIRRYEIYIVLSPGFKSINVGFFGSSRGRSSEVPL